MLTILPRQSVITESYTTVIMTDMKPTISSIHIWENQSMMYWVLLAAMDLERKVQVLLMCLILP